MNFNKEAIAVTLLAIFTAAVIAFIVILSEKALSNDNTSAVSSPTSSSSRVVDESSAVGKDVHAVHRHHYHHKKGNYNNSLVSVSSKVQAMFIIGDSSVDCGENTLFYPFLRRNLSLFPCSNGSDSTLVPYILASKMGLSDISPFYEQNGTIEGIQKGLNYGSAGATILAGSLEPSFQSLNQQLRQSFETIQLLQLQLGETESSNLLKASLFYVSLGKEDFINFLTQNASYSPDFYTASQPFGQLLANEVTSALRSLYNIGARKIVTMGVLPLGCAPRAIVEWYFSNNGRNNRRIKRCVNEINQVVIQFNQRLNDQIIALNVESPDAQFVFCDAYQGLKQMIAHPQKYGFLDARRACCGRGWRGAAGGCESMKMACCNISSHVWWDFYNPTQAVNSLLAESAWSGKPFLDLCRPMSVERLVDFHLH